jgi:hypothetical protein
MERVRDGSPGGCAIAAGEYAWSLAEREIRIRTAIAYEY